MNESKPEVSREDLETFSVRQHKLIQKLKNEIGDLTSVRAEQQIIIEELQESNTQLRSLITSSNIQPEEEVANESR